MVVTSPALRQAGAWRSQLLQFASVLWSVPTPRLCVEVRSNHGRDARSPLPGLFHESVKPVDISLGLAAATPRWAASAKDRWATRVHAM
jgi:hypothetical protein